LLQASAGQTGSSSFTGHQHRLHAVVSRRHPGGQLYREQESLQPERSHRHDHRGNTGLGQAIAIALGTAPWRYGRTKLRDLIETPAERTLGIARAFVSARQKALPLADYPGPLPPDMEAGYAVQEAAIGLWPDRIVGWKIGLVPASQQAALGVARLAGPIFLEGVTRVAGALPEPVRLAAPDKLTCRTTIDGEQVGVAWVATLPGGPLEALRFLLGHLAARGRSLRAGQWVSTGAITGVHRIFPGQQGSVELLGHGRVDVRVVAAAAR
jgi:2-keto-4-pentenoate hydratase